MEENVLEIYEQSQPKLQTKVYKIVMPVYFCFAVLCVVGCIVVEAVSDNQTVTGITAGVLCALLIAVTLILFLAVLPKLQIKQARLDIKNYDFTPYVADGKEETFYCETVVQINCYNPFPFNEEDAQKTFKGWQRVEHYLNGLAEVNRLNKIIHLDAYNEFIPLYTYGTNEPKFIVGTQTDNEQTTVTVAEQQKIIFTDDGVKIDDWLFGYKRVIATAEASFSFKTYARIMLDCGNGIGASLAISPRILAVLDKFGVTVNDRFIADFILADPSFAFDKIAALTSPKRIKKFASKFKNRQPLAPRQSN
ncbi:MAG: hypothetical protein K2L72_04795 [Clostridia bacterium]|nr:hypothetical protein [Clostridia bacterium]